MATSLIMLLGGWFAETDQLDKISGFIIGMAGWLYILYEVFAGEAAALSTKIGNKASQQAFNTLKTIVSLGWSIYPLGYFLAYILAVGGWAPNSYFETEIVNVVYNLADLVNKGAFGMCIYAAARSDTSH
jgi:bacteriorhodopsin